MRENEKNLGHLQTQTEQDVWISETGDGQSGRIATNSVQTDAGTGSLSAALEIHLTLNTSGSGAAVPFVSNRHTPHTHTHTHTQESC